MTEKYDLSDDLVYSRLWTVELKLKGMRHLISSCSSGGIFPLAGDDSDIYRGIGTIFLELANDVGRIWREIENDEIKAVRKTGSGK